MLFKSYLRFLTLSRLVPRLLGVSRNSELAYFCQRVRIGVSGFSNALQISKEKENLELSTVV